MDEKTKLKSNKEKHEGIKIHKSFNPKKKKNINNNIEIIKKSEILE